MLTGIQDEEVQRMRRLWLWSRNFHSEVCWGRKETFEVKVRRTSFRVFRPPLGFCLLTVAAERAWVQTFPLWFQIWIHSPNSCRHTNNTILVKALFTVAVPTVPQRDGFTQHISCSYSQGGDVIGDGSGDLGGTDAHNGVLGARASWRTPEAPLAQRCARNAQ